MANTKSLYKTTFRIPICPKDIGHFIGKGGSNFKKIILESKKKILGIDGDIPSEDWNKVTILLKFEKQDTDCIALIGCQSERHAGHIQEVISKFSKIHNDEIDSFHKKANTPKILIYRIGAPHRMIGRLIGVSGSNVSELKNMINNVEGVEEYPGIYIEEQESRLPSGSFRNMGERNSPENIILRITLKGSPDFENIHKIIQEYLDKYLVEDEEDDTDHWCPVENEDDFWNSFDDIKPQNLDEEFEPEPEGEEEEAE